jgi:GcrA cell cycle regulator
MNPEATSPGPAFARATPPGTIWTTERVQQLRSFVTAGFTCSQIADEIGVTRNAVIGKIHRLGLSPGRKPAGVAQRMRAASTARTQTTNTQSRRALIARLMRATTADAPPLAPATTTIEAPAVESGPRRTLLELTAGCCRWPLGEPGHDDFGFCGNDAVTGISYCAGHARLAYRLPSGRRA